MRSCFFQNFIPNNIRKYLKIEPSVFSNFLKYYKGDFKEIPSYTLQSIFCIFYLEVLRRFLRIFLWVIYSLKGVIG